MSGMHMGGMQMGGMQMGGMQMGDMKMEAMKRDNQSKIHLNIYLLMVLLCEYYRFRSKRSKEQDRGVQKHAGSCEGEQLCSDQVNF